MILVVGARDAIRQKSVWAYDNYNNLLWSYDTGSDTRKVVLDSSDNVYIVGVRADNGDGGGNRSLWKLDSDGNYLNGADVGTSDTYDIVLDDSGNMYVGGSGMYMVPVDFGAHTTISASACLALTRDSSGNLYCFLSTGGYGYVRKYNSEFVHQWDEKIPIRDGNKPYPRGFAMLSNGNVVAACGSNSGDYVFCYQPDGTYVWDTKTDGYTSAGQGRIKVATGDVIYQSTIGAFHCLDSDGNITWSIDPSGGGYLWDLFLDGNDIPYVCGVDDDNINLWKVDTTNYVLIKVLGALQSAALRGLSGTSDIDLGKTKRFVKYIPASTQSTWVDDNYWKAQTFEHSAPFSISRVKLKIYREDLPSIFTVSIRAVNPLTGLPTGPDLCVGTIDGDLLTEVTVGEWREIVFSRTAVILANTPYAIVCGTGVDQIVGQVFLRAEAGYADGELCDSNDSGVVWTGTASDLLFEAWGLEPVEPAVYDLFEMQLDIDRS